MLRPTTERTGGVAVLPLVRALSGVRPSADAVVCSRVLKDSAPEGHARALLLLSAHLDLITNRRMQTVHGTPIHHGDHQVTTAAK